MISRGEACLTRRAAVPEADSAVPDQSSLEGSSMPPSEHVPHQAKTLGITELSS